MRKFLGFIAFVILAAIPFNTRGATSSTMEVKATTGSYSLTFSESEQDNEGYFTVTITAKQSDGHVFSPTEPLSIKMTTENVEYVENSIQGQGVWVPSVSGNSMILTPGAEVSDASFTIATMKFKNVGGADDNCRIAFEMGERKVTVDRKKTVKPAPTGSALPYVVVLAGAALATGVYFVTRRSTKFYRI